MKYLNLMGTGVDDLQNYLSRMEAEICSLSYMNDELSCENSELKYLLQKVLDDSECGVVPSSHLDRIKKAIKSETKDAQPNMSKEEKRKFMSGEE